MTDDAPNGSFRGKVAVVTGGTTGIGFATAAKLAAAGASVLVCGIEAVEANAAAAALAGHEGGVEAVVADVAVPEEMDELAARAVARFGGIDVLVCSAGIQAYGTVVEMPPAQFERVLAVNLKGVYHAARACIPELRKRGGGSIVAVASVQSLAAQRGAAAYVASKGGVLALVKAMALDHAPDGIRVNCVLPGSVDTPMLRNSAALFTDGDSTDDLVAEWGRSHPLGRVARPEEVADAIVFLASDRARFVTGAELRVDGGLLAQIPVTLPRE